MLALRQDERVFFSEMAERPINYLARIHDICIEVLSRISARREPNRNKPGAGEVPEEMINCQRLRQ
jgi:hypothetical protein